VLADAGSIPAASTKFPAVSVIFTESRPLDALPRKHFLETTLTSYLLGGRVYTAPQASPRTRLHRLQGTAAFPFLSCALQPPR